MGNTFQHQYHLYIRQSDHAMRLVRQDGLRVAIKSIEWTHKPFIGLGAYVFLERNIGIGVFLMPHEIHRVETFPAKKVQP